MSQPEEQQVGHPEPQPEPQPQPQLEPERQPQPQLEPERQTQPERQLETQGVAPPFAQPEDQRPAGVPPFVDAPRLDAGLGAGEGGSSAGPRSRSRRVRAQGAVPGLARFAASTAWHTTRWGVRTSARTGVRVVRATTSAEEAGALLEDLSGAVEGTVGTVSDLLRTAALETAAAVTALDERLEAALDPDAGRDARHGADRAGREARGDRAEREARPDARHDTRQEPPAPPTLREQGRDLLRRSRQVGPDEDEHPAFARVLSELAPDEARVLLLLLEVGPQPSVDVRTGGPGGLVSSQLVAPGLSMVGSRAGCRAPARAPAYLSNLARLGLVWFSRDGLRDPMPYQVLEAQPDVLEALHSVRFAKVVRRSIHLTPFGDDFCRACLVEPDQSQGDYPHHASPGHDEAPSSGGR